MHLSGGTSGLRGNTCLSELHPEDKLREGGRRGKLREGSSAADVISGW